MMLMDVVIACLLAVTSVYCWRLNGKIGAFKSAKQEMDQIIRAFDSSIRQAHDSISILKAASTDKNIQVIRDLEKIRYLANDLAFLVEKGEKIASSLEGSIRQSNASRPQAQQARRTQVVEEEYTPLQVPPRRAAAPQRKPEPTLEELAEVKEMVDTLARSYVSEQLAGPRPAAGALASPQQPRRAAAPQPKPQASAKETKARAIEKVLNHLASRGPDNAPSMPPVPPRDLKRKAEDETPQPAKAGRRFFDTLRVITPNE